MRTIRSFWLLVMVSTLLLGGCLARQYTHDEILDILAQHWKDAGDTQTLGESNQPELDASPLPETMQPPKDTLVVADADATPGDDQRDAVDGAKIDAALSPPTAKIDAGPKSLSTESTASFVLSCDQSACTYVCNVDNKGYYPCSAAPTFATLGDGAHTLAVKATANGLEQTVATNWSWTIDTQPPSTTLNGTLPKALT